MKIKITKELEVKHLSCSLGVRYWEDSVIDGAEDDAENPKMPCIEEDWDGKFWRIEINAETGQIENWPKGRAANIRYKVCEACVIKAVTDEGETEYQGYVPQFLDTYGYGYGDYVLIDINEEGFIEDWCKYDDMFDLTGMED